jgi:CheY-like chemotaxis protein
MIGIVQDITARKQAEESLREMDRRKDEFLATLAHELRNPLAPIRHAAQISRIPTATEAQKRWSTDVIIRQVQHMSLLLDDLLDISRITRGTLELRLELTDLAAAIEAAVETARPGIETKRHKLHIDIPTERVQIAADPLRLSQILSNLLTNAAKYTDPDGEIRLSAIATSNDVTIRVADTGIGIAPDTLPSVFEMFSQLHNGRARSEGGLGIGLALSKGLVELHGGSIEARSRGAGQGSEFVVRLPRPAAAERRAPAASEPIRNDTVSRRVLVADDNRDGAESLAILLQVEGHEVQVVHDGAAALAALEQSQPDVALLDIGMPGLNGYEVAQRVRSTPIGRSVLLIAITGWGQDSDKARALESGFDHHFTKPIEPERITELVRIYRR